jgi:hypothetical protein
MIPNEIDQTLNTIGQVKHIAQFNATDETMPRILVDLSDKMYNKKELAVVREYSTNAVDAMKKVGKPISDIQVTMPTIESLEFKIRDFGTGLTEEDIKNIYCVLGKSDKRNSNEYNGMFGYGCKSGFAHSDSFTVTSWINGEKTVYQCIKGDSRTLHSVVRLLKCESNEPNGIEISIPVKQSSLWTFHSVATELYKYWDVLPTIHNLNESNVENIKKWKDSAPSFSGEGWELRKLNGSYSSAHAYMGYVAYPIDWNVLYEKMSLTQETRGLFNILRSNHVLFTYNIGDISFVNNREGLEYTEDTIKALTNRITSIFNSIRGAIQEKFDNCKTIWEAKQLYYALFDYNKTSRIFRDFGGSIDPILDGDLSQLESTFFGSLFWNRLPINSSTFSSINIYDNANLDAYMPSHDPIDPVMCSFKKKGSRVKTARCRVTEQTCIVASSSTAIVLNDCNKKSGFQSIARDLIFADKSEIKIVHILTFKTEELKKRFFGAYQFDSVPMYKMSELKKIAKTNPKTYTRSGNKRPVNVIDMYTVSMSSEQISLRDITEESYFLRAENSSSSSRPIGFHGNGVYCDYSYMSKLKQLITALNLDIDKIYIIPDQTFNSKWFTTKSVEDKQWINVWDLLKEECKGLDQEEILNTDAAVREILISPANIDYINSKIKNRDISAFSKFHYSCESAMVDNKKNVMIKNSLNCLGMWDYFRTDAKATINFAAINNELMERYPLLMCLSNILRNDVQTGDVDNIIDYINAMDSGYDVIPDDDGIDINDEEKVELVA